LGNILLSGKLFIQRSEPQSLSALITNICKQPDDCHKSPIYETIRTKKNQLNTWLGNRFLLNFPDGTGMCS
jgi:hypothetical protein